MIDMKNETKPEQIEKHTATILALTTDKVMSVYNGKAHKCCCGCAGTHSYNSKHVVAASANRGYLVDAEECNDKEIGRILKLVQAAAGEAAANQVDGEENDFGTSELYFITRGKREYIVYLLPAVDGDVDGNETAQAKYDTMVRLAAQAVKE